MELPEIENKVVYNACYGGFGLSTEAVKRYKELKGLEDSLEYFDMYEIPRHDKNLIKIVEEMGDLANGDYSDLVIEVIEGDHYFIDNYDGSEEVKTPSNLNWIKIGN